MVILCPLKKPRNNDLPISVSILEAQTVDLNYHFLLKEKEQVEFNKHNAITKPSQWEIRGQMAGFSTYKL